MNQGPGRVVLGFYSSDETYSEQAYQSIRQITPQAQYFRASGPVDSSSSVGTRYSSLRLEGEDLIAVEVDASLVPQVVSILRTAGDPSIFVALAPDASLDVASEAPGPVSWRSVIDRLNEYETGFKQARAHLTEATRLDHAVTESAKWLLDNTHLIRGSIAEIRRALPAGFRRTLSKYSSPDGNLHVYELAHSIVRNSDNTLTEENLREAVGIYQRKTALSIAELWVFPVMLRFSVLEALAILAKRISREQQLREAAYLWANRLAAGARAGSESLAKILKLIQEQPFALDSYFVTCLAEQLQDEETALVPVQQWIESRLKTALAELVRPEHIREAAETLSVANAFNSLRTLSRIDFAKFFEAQNVVEIELRRDPSGIYPQQDFRTRDRCRRVVETISRRSGANELDVAGRAIEFSQTARAPEHSQVAWFLLAGGVTDLECEFQARIPFRTRLIRFLRNHATLFYLAGVAVLTLALLSVAMSLAWEMSVRQTGTLAILGLLALFPVSELAIQIINAFIISSFLPEPLPKLDFDEGIPPEHATLVVVPMMLSGQDVVRQELEKLEVRFLANQDNNLFFSLFSDFTDAGQQTTPADADLLEAARTGIETLNARYRSARFLLFHRSRVWSETEQKWIGRERKRGKLEELNLFLRDKGHPEIRIVGVLPQAVRYVITLDADTQLPPDTGRRLVGTIAHPLNRAVLDPVTKVRKRGFAIIQPRVSIGLPGATASRFTRIIADTSGTDPYCQAVSDAQQDLFGEAIFHGKAIYDVEAFDESLGNRFPAETLLSHDLIEGSHVGVGLATDIELFENMPLDYSSFSRRQHRWIRGDWQIADWILARVPHAGGSRERNPLSMISRWRILDNLRRSVVPIASMLLLLFGWIASTVPGAWSLVVGLAVALPAAAPLLDRFARRIHGSVIGWQGAHDELLRALMMIAFLPHQAWISGDAIARVLYRRVVSRRHLLEWQTAESTGSDSRLHLNSTMQQMIAISGGSLLLAIALLWRGQFGPVAIFVTLWIGSPGLLYWLSRPASNRADRRLLRDNSRLLHGLARQTWRFFDDLVGPDTNWMPPDNTQVALRVEVANRTSPTNIGLWLCSALSARDFGYVTPDDLLDRATKTIETMNRLQRYEGHLLNWYDTRTAEPLLPRYVSTVDSGNLLACLWVFAQGASDVVKAPMLSQTCLRGLADTLAQVEALSENDPSLAVPLHTLRKLLRGKVETHQLIARLRMAKMPAGQLSDLCQYAADDERAYWAGKLSSEVGAWNRLVDLYFRWVETLTQFPDSALTSLGEDITRLRRRVLQSGLSLDTLASGGPQALQQILNRRHRPGVEPRLTNWLTALDADYQEAQRNAAQSSRSWRSLAERSLEFAEDIDMRFLYDNRRKLFGIGYLVGGPVEFTSHYDLLASECRLASLVSIAKGDIPLDHWFALGRPRTGNPEGQTLLSWSGTMFEYLMPLLFTRMFPNSLLDSACRNAVEQQMSWGRERHLPWGVSESAYSALDSNQIYQYHAFGVPSLALKAIPDDEHVVAPYATILSLQVEPRSAIANISRLRALGLEGPMGLYEAIDFTRQSTRGGSKGVIIYTYMSHHQGMSLLSLNNVLHRGVMQRRFHGDRRVRAVESLLFERVPQTPLPTEDIRAGLTGPVTVTADDPAERVWKENTAVPRVHLYGNGRYALMVSNAGGSYSRWNEFDISRWRSDPTRDNWGSFVYVRDLKANAMWSTAFQPAGGNIGVSSVRFLADHTEFHRRVLDVETVQSVTVAAEDDAELRRVTVTNWSTRTRELDFTSYVELSLAPHGADAAHQAFAKLFIETEYADDGLLIAYRRLRSPDDAPIWSAHLVVGVPRSSLQYETDRGTFIGRNSTTAVPDAMRRDLNSSAGTVVDPIFSLRCGVTLAPRDRLEISFVTLAARSREDLMTLVAKYRRPGAVAQAFEMMWTRSQLEFRYLGIGQARAHRFQELASYLLYPTPRLRSTDRMARNRLGQTGLWAFGISGDLPILSVTIADDRSLNFVREVLQAHTYWRMRGFKADLVVLNQEAPSYDSPLRGQLQRLIEAHSAETGIDKPGGVFLRDWYPMPEDHRTLILSSASVALSGNRGSLQQQLAGIPDVPAVTTKFSGAGGAEEPSRSLPFLELPYFNGQGGFTTTGNEYAVYLKPGDNTPAPWVNVMANAGFGTLVSESGSGFTWRGNSQMNRLTTWQNDPVSDEPSEVIYLRDEDSGIFWTPTPQPVRERDAYRARHGQGYTVFEHNSHAIGQELTVFVPVNRDGTGDPVRICMLRLRNESSRPRKLSVTYFAEWVLGGVRESSQTHIQTMRDDPSGAILARQYWSGSYAGQVAFASSYPLANSWSGDRTQFLGRNRTLSRPAAMERPRLDNRTGAALDPAAALQVQISLEVGEQKYVVFLLGQTETPEECRTLAARYQTADQIENALDATRRWWDSLLGALQVTTPVLSADLLLNRWLLYQSLSCRFWARSALYQSSGAMGFRDQLQDSLAFVYAAPHLTRTHILLAAAHQFTEGDVQHWWHQETGMGVRTRCSDDLVWLPFVVAHYVEVTGDREILEEVISFIETQPLGAHEAERLVTPSISAETASLWEHCRRALDHAFQIGQHGLPLMGNGDWNDGMNHVGHDGRGESVWLAWFLAATLNSFSDVLDEHAEGSRYCAVWRERASQLAAATEASSWDGEWYTRAFFDDGSPLGSHVNSEARIDSLPQSWSVISGLGEPARSRQAMESAQSMLVDQQHKLVRLFTPPFDHSQPHPGYIMGYPPGLRENGGQYTHGSLWLAMAWARLGEGGRAAGLLTMMSPIERTRTSEDAASYCGEPYAVAADVSMAPGRMGRAGWTCYTGSAAWMYRIWIEEVLGFRLRGDSLTVKPAIPDDWPGFEIRFRYRSATYEIHVQRGAAAEAFLDGAPAGGQTIRLSDDGRVHTVNFWIPFSAATPPERPDVLRIDKLAQGSYDRPGLAGVH